MADLLSCALSIGSGILTWYNHNIEAKDRCAFVVPSINILSTCLTSIRSARLQKKLNLTVSEMVTLDAAVEQTFMCLRDIIGITQLFDSKKKKTIKTFWNPTLMLDNIVGKRGDLQYCIQMLSICMQTSTFLKTSSPAAPEVATATGVMTPTHAVDAPTDAKGIMTAVLHDTEARSFWMSNFEHATVVPYALFKHKLEVAFNNGAAYDTLTQQTIQLNVDPESKEKVLFFMYQKWVNHNYTIRGALRVAALDIVQAPVVVGEYKDPALASPSKHAVSPTKTPKPSAPPATTQFKPTIRGAADPENPPADLEFIWSDPNIDKDWNAALVNALATAGRKWLPFDSANEVVSWFTAHPEFLRSPKLRIMSNNRIYNMEADYSTTSASMEICTHLRKKRSLLPVLIYCGYTIDNALKVAAQLRKTKATNDEEVATRYAKGEPIDW